MAPSAPSCLSTGGGLYLNGKPYILLFWTSPSDAGYDGTFAKLEMCSGAACSGFAEFDTAPVEAYLTGYGYDPCAEGYALRSKYEVGVLQTLANNTVYRFRIRNEKAGEYSSYSNIAEWTTAAAPSPPSGDVSIPSPPTNLVLSGSGNTIDLDWTDNSANETGFSIEKSILSSSFFWGPWFSFATVAANTSSYSDTGLQYETTYRYRVRSFNTNGYSAYSNDPYRETDALAVAGLAAPTFTSAVLEIVGFVPQVKLDWTDNSDSETAFFIERRVNSGPFQLIYATAPNVLTFTDTEVVDGNTYSYRLRAYRSSDDAYSPYSAIRSVTVEVFIPPGEGIARHFDGSAAPSPNDVLFSPNVSATYNAITWAGWVTRDSIGTRNGLAGRLFSADNGWSVFVDENNLFSLRTNSTTASVACPDLTDWTYLAVTYDSALGSNQVKFYSGNSAATIELIGVGTMTGSFAELSSYGLCIGYITFAELHSGGAVNAWNGSLDQVGIYSSALTLPELRDACVCESIVSPDTIVFVLPITGDDPEVAYTTGGVTTANFTVVGTTVVPGGCVASSGGTVVVPTGWAITHCSDGPVSTGGVLRDNQMSNNGQGNIASNIYQLPSITIDNPGTENTYIRRGAVLIP